MSSSAGDKSVCVAWRMNITKRAIQNFKSASYGLQQNHATAPHHNKKN